LSTTSFVMIDVYAPLVAVVPPVDVPADVVDDELDDDEPAGLSGAVDAGDPASLLARFSLRAHAETADASRSAEAARAVARVR